MKEKPTWRLFEEEVRLLVEEFGYRAEATKPTGDGGIDVVAKGRRGKVIIQCKLLGRGKVGGPTIDQLAGTCRREKAAHAICVTTSGFTKQAIEFAEASDIVLLDRENIEALCRRKSLTIPSLTALECPTGEILLVPSPSATVGRARDRTLVVSHPTVSRHHARFERDGVRLRLHDCNSTNGTWINGQRVLRPCLLNYGDNVRLGECSLRVVLQTSSEGTA